MGFFNLFDQLFERYDIASAHNPLNRLPTAPSIFFDLSPSLQIPLLDIHQTVLLHVESYKDNSVRTLISHNSWTVDHFTLSEQVNRRGTQVRAIWKYDPLPDYDHFSDEFVGVDSSNNYYGG